VWRVDDVVNVDIVMTSSKMFEEEKCAELCECEIEALPEL
jgi:hypothetical protein